MFRLQNVSASEVLSTRDMNVRTERDVTEIVGTFLTVAEAVVAHWVEYSKGLLLFVMVPGDERSGEFYIYGAEKQWSPPVSSRRPSVGSWSGCWRARVSRVASACRDSCA